MDIYNNLVKIQKSLNLSKIKINEQDKIINQIKKDLEKIESEKSKENENRKHMIVEKKRLLKVLHDEYSDEEMHGPFKLEPSEFSTTESIISFEETKSFSVNSKNSDENITRLNNNIFHSTKQAINVMKSRTSSVSLNETGSPTESTCNFEGVTHKSTPKKALKQSEELYGQIQTITSASLQKKNLDDNSNANCIALKFNNPEMNTSLSKSLQEKNENKLRILENIQNLTPKQSEKHIDQSKTQASAKMEKIGATVLANLQRSRLNNPNIMNTSLSKSKTIQNATPKKTPSKQKEDSCVKIQSDDDMDIEKNSTNFIEKMRKRKLSIDSEENVIETKTLKVMNTALSESNQPFGKKSHLFNLVLDFSETIHNISISKYGIITISDDNLISYLNYNDLNKASIQFRSACCEHKVTFLKTIKYDGILTVIICNELNEIEMICLKNMKKIFYYKSREKITYIDYINQLLIIGFINGKVLSILDINKQTDFTFTIPNTYIESAIFIKVKRHLQAIFGCKDGKLYTPPLDLVDTSVWLDCQFESVKNFYSIQNGNNILAYGTDSVAIINKHKNEVILSKKFKLKFQSLVCSTKYIYMLFTNNKLKIYDMPIYKKNQKTKFRMIQKISINTAEKFFCLELIDDEVFLSNNKSLYKIKERDLKI